jgi:hypothetical protein
VGRMVTGIFSYSTHDSTVQPTVRVEIVYVGLQWECALPFYLWRRAFFISLILYKSLSPNYQQMFILCFFVSLCPSDVENPGKYLQLRT